MRTGDRRAMALLVEEGGRLLGGGDLRVVLDEALGSVAQQGQRLGDGVQGRCGQVLVQRVRQADGLRLGLGVLTHCQHQGRGGVGQRRGPLDPTNLLRKRSHTQRHPYIGFILHGIGHMKQYTGCGEKFDDQILPWI